MTMDILDLLLVESDRWTAVESHICQNRADMGHPIISARPRNTRLY
ncbi:MAG: hypothetical protein QOE55_2435 [Acidobacteriaceae bacterium]|nr:hypothetical protein [Acidobacteriaceae bacterium]